MRHTGHFILTPDHVRLLRRMTVEWCGDEYGAPAIDPKRPYGNGDVEDDVARILGWPITTDDIARAKASLTAESLHREMETALQIVLITGAFEPGEYRTTDKYDSRSWVKVG